METTVSAEQLRAIGDFSIEREQDAYLIAMLRDARLLEEAAGPTCRFVLLGSIATHKYTQPLLDIFGERLLFPSDFVGRGNLSRGGLMLRRPSGRGACVRTGGKRCASRVEAP